MSLLMGKCFGAVRALKMHGGGPPVTAGTPLAAEYKEENVDLVRKGVSNLKRHITNTLQYGIPVVVAINKFATDTDAEMAVVREASLDAGELLEYFSFDLTLAVLASPRSRS